MHPYLSVGPGLPGCPLDGVEAVLLLVAERIPLALGFMPPSHVLVNEDIATACKENRRDVRTICGSTCPKSGPGSSLRLSANGVKHRVAAKALFML